MTPGRPGPSALAAVAGCLICSGFVITMGRAPTTWPDAQLYASIARSLQTHGSGVPSTIWFSSTAVDHLPFYGPVYFALTSLSFTFLGVSIVSSKAAGLLGVLLIIQGTALLARLLSGEDTRWRWATVLVLLTPEVGAAATSGDVETLAAGLELMALAIYARGLLGAARPAVSGAGAGAVVLAAALTTPRTYPFVAAFLFCGCGAALASRRRSIAFAQWAAMAGVFAAGFAVWTFVEHGGPLQWAGNMRVILTQEDTDVAVLDTARRVFAFNWSSVVTPVAALLGAALAGWYGATQFRREHDGHVATAFALATPVCAGLVIVWGMNITFSLGMYFALPVFAVVLALPGPVFRVRTPMLVAAVSALLVADVGVAGVRYARIAATWNARDPEPLTRFLRSHVPAGSSVVGPNALYFFPVEGIGAHYRSFASASPADWARWAIGLDAFAPPPHRRLAGDERADRFFIWQAGDDLPGEYACARRVASYTAPPVHLNALGPFSASWDVGFPSTELYRLPSDCPVGYDPTGMRTE